MPKYAQVYPSVPKYVQVCPSMSKYAQVCPSMSKYAQVCPNMPKYAQVWPSISKCAQVCPSMSKYAQVCPCMPKYAQVWLTCPTPQLWEGLFWHGRRDIPTTARARDITAGGGQNRRRHVSTPNALSNYTEIVRFLANVSATPIIGYSDYRYTAHGPIVQIRRMEILLL